MRTINSFSSRASAACVALAIGCGIGSLTAISAQQPPAGAPAGAQAGRGGGGGRGGGAAVFTASDTNKDGAVTRDEFKGTFDGWYTTWDSAKSDALTREQLTAGLAAALPQPPPPPPAVCGGQSVNPQLACPADVEKMMAALPDTAPAKPQRPRNILVLGKAAGFVHTSIPLAAKFVEAAGTKTGAWKTTISYNAADINTENLKQYDAVVLDSNTGCFLDDPNDKAATDARRAALLAYIRGGKGIAAIHATTDSYHGTNCGGGAPGGGARAGGAPGGAAPGGGARAGGAPGGGRGGGPGAALVAPIMAQGDTNADQRISRAELNALTDAWFDKLDPEKSGRVSQADFGARFASLTPQAARGPAPAQQQAQVPGGQPLWPEWNTIIGGYFKFHWNDPQLITVKIDDPKSPLTKMFKGQSFDINDETYTYNQESFSRTNVHVLTSVDYNKMSATDKAAEPTPRTDGDYALSWIRPEGKGRLFYEAHGHHERIYAIKPMLEHMIAGIQYALGDLKADDSPSVKK